MARLYISIIPNLFVSFYAIAISLVMAILTGGSLLAIPVYILSIALFLSSIPGVLELMIKHLL